GASVHARACERCRDRHLVRSGTRSRIWSGDPGVADGWEENREIPNRRGRARQDPDESRPLVLTSYFLLLTSYFAVTMKCPRRFCCQQLSLCSVQTGASLPLLTISMRLAATPRFTR